MHVADAVNIEDLRLMAKRRVPRAIFDFFDGGAEDEATAPRSSGCASCPRCWSTFPKWKQELIC
jgi:hypothetical protein